MQEEEEETEGPSSLCIEINKSRIFYLILMFLSHLFFVPLYEAVFATSDCCFMSEITLERVFLG